MGRGVGPSMYYVIKILGFSDPTPLLFVITFSTERNKKLPKHPYIKVKRFLTQVNSGTPADNYHILDPLNPKEKICSSIGMLKRQI